MCRKMIYLISFVLVLSFVGTSAAQEIDPNLVGWWKMDETSGTVAADSSGYGNDGTVLGGAQWVSGYIDGAIDLDGDDDYVDCGYDPIFDTANEMTLAAWVAIRSIPTAWACVVSKGEYSWRLSNENMERRFHFGITIWSAPNPSLAGDTVVGLDEWHHVAGTYDGQNINIYLDGWLDGTVATSSPIGVNAANVLIGENPEAAGRNWDGLIDDVRIYNRVLSEAEIGELMPTQLKATAPLPYDKSILSTTDVELSWIPGETASGHHLYIGENYEDVENGTGDTDKGLISQTSFEGYEWEIGNTYYWRVAETMSDGTVIHPGDVWSLAILPLTASKPIPDDGAEYVNTDVLLKWTAGAGSIRHHVYFHENQAAVSARDPDADKGNVEDPNFSPGQLDYNTEYFWVVDESDGTTTHQGSVWSFTTVGPMNGAKGQYYNNADLTGQPVLTRIDPKIDFVWGADSPDPIVNSDNFSVRWTAELAIPASDTYTFYSISDDNARLWINGQLLIDNWDSENAWAIEEAESIYLEAGWTSLKMEFFDSAGDAIAQLKWESSTIPRQIISPAALSPPLRASGEIPGNGATGVRHTLTLRWTAGDQTTQHNVYFGTDFDAVDNADITTPGIYRGQQDLENTEYIPTEAPLQWGQTYYWRIDEVEADGTIRKGQTWNFTAADYAVVEDFEDYDDVNNIIYYTWEDYYANNTGMTVGHFEPPFAEQSIVHNGSQSMYMRYDNDGTVNEGTDYEQSGTLLYSEAERLWADAQDWTADGTTSLAMWFRGIPASVGSFTAGPPITMTAGGTDIWDTADEFHFAYKQLSGEGSIVAKVVSLTNTNTWAKAGVMIRQTLEPGSTHAMMVVTPGQGVSFQRRITADAGSEETTQTDITAPQWVRLTRSGNTFTGEYSANGSNWTTLGSIDMPMLLDTYIGLCLTSHNVDATCTAEFSNVTTDGTGDWQSQDIGINSNIPEPMYVVLEDNAGNSAVVTHPDPAASAIGSWTEWNIPFTDFTGVDMQAINKMSIGVGDRANPQLGGAGDLYIDDIGLKLP
jgi:regulation of enolase protein 1 (concanavalin A-like superfamily)